MSEVQEHFMYNFLNLIVVLHCPCATFSPSFLFFFSCSEFLALQELGSGCVEAVGQMAGHQGALPDREQLCGHLKHHSPGTAPSLHQSSIVKQVD